MPDLTRALPSTATSLNPLGRVKTTSYTCLPPCKNFVIELAIAGFTKEDIEIETKESKISIRSILPKKIDDGESKEEYLHKGISKRAFNRTFTLASDVFVKDASMVNGLLIIDLERIIPDKKKSRMTYIN